MHFNLLNALFLGDLLDMFTSKGWKSDLMRRRPSTILYFRLHLKQFPQAKVLSGRWRKRLANSRSCCATQVKTSSMRKQRWTNWDYRFPRWFKLEIALLLGPRASRPPTYQNDALNWVISLSKRSGRDARAPSEELECSKGSPRFLEVIN